MIGDESIQHSKSNAEEPQQPSKNKSHTAKNNLKRYSTKYKTKCIGRFPWATLSPKGKLAIYCNFCKNHFCLKNLGQKGLQAHQSTSKHIQASQLAKSIEGTQDKNSTGTTQGSFLHSTSRVIPTSADPDFILPRDEAFLYNPCSNCSTKSNSDSLNIVEKDLGIKKSPSNISSQQALIADDPFEEEECHADTPMRPSNPPSPNSSNPPKAPAPLPPKRKSTRIALKFSIKEPEYTLSSEMALTESITVDSENHLKKLLRSRIQHESMVHSENLTENSYHSDLSNLELQHKNLVDSDKERENGPDEAKTENSSKIKSTQPNSPDPIIRVRKLPCVDDLKCNVCGVYFWDWKDLKIHLEKHIEDANKILMQIPNSKQTKKRGRPLGSKNKEKLLNNMKKGIPIKFKQKKHSNFTTKIMDSFEENSTLKSEFKSDPIPSNSSFEDEDLQEAAEDIISEPHLYSPPPKKPVKKRRKFHCRACEGILESREALRIHFLTHNNGKPFKCEACERCFSKKKNLEIHINSQHSEEAIIECPICKKKLSNKPNLRIHMKIHEGVKPFECPICEKKFSRKANMKLHKLYHSSKRGFICEVCGQSYYTLNALKRHAYLHTGERNFVCETCGATYVTRSDLKVHLYKHRDDKPYPCTLCQKKFIRSHDLMIHMRYHKNELRYTCDECGKKFVESGNFNRHMRRHTGERPYTCDVCSRSFSQIQHYKIHLRSAHPDKIEELDDKYSRKNKLQKTRLCSKITPTVDESFEKNTSNVSDLGQNMQHQHVSEPTLNAINAVDQNPICDIIPNQPSENNISTAVSSINSVAHVENSGLTTIGHAVNVSAMQESQSTQMRPENVSWGLPYNHYLYNASTIPQYSSIVDVCPQ